jgi:hypothetical protein
MANDFLKIFSDGWERFKSAVHSYNKTHYNKQVEAVLRCGDPVFGFSQYFCLNCGKDSRIVAHSCKSKFCLRCGRVDGENFAQSIASKLYEDVDYRHLVLTIPAQFRTVFYKNRFTGDLYSAFISMGWEFVKSFMKVVAGVDLECGCIIVLHTVGRKSDYKPHLHIMLMSGGINPEGQWISLKRFDFSTLNRTWKETLLAGMRKWDESGEFEAVFQEVESKYKGFYAHIDVNPAPKKRRNLIRYLSKYLCRPQISLKRLLKYSSKSSEVVYKYNSHSTGKSEVERTSVINFIGRMVQQILPPRFKRIRYYGLQSPSNRSRLTAKVCEAVGRLILLPEIERRSEVPARSSYKDLIELWWGEDPFRCKECGHQMELSRIWKFGKGWIFNIFDILFGHDIGPPGNLPDLCYD